jgi:hypothetical protein
VRLSETVVNPPDKKARLTWHADDELLVVRNAAESSRL